MNKNFVARFFVGFSMPFQALSLLRSNRRLLILSIVPVAITILTMIAFFIWGLPLVGTLLGVVLPQASGILMSVLYWVGVILGYLVAIVFCVVMVVLVANLISLPFSSLIAEETLKSQDFLDAPPFSVKRWALMTLNQLRVGLLRTAIFILIGIFLFFISLVPFLQIVTAFCGLVIIAFDAMDYSLELKDLGLRQRLRTLRNYFWEIAGFAVCFGATTLVPLLNFLLLPVGIVSGGLLVSKLKINRLE